MIVFKSKGFTLIELLVVISVISLLGSIVLASLNQTRVTAGRVVLKQEIIQLRNLLELYHDPNTGYLKFFSKPTLGLGLPNTTGDPWGWIATTQECDYSYGPSSATSNWNPEAARQFNLVCKKILSISNPSNTIGPPDCDYCFTLIITGPSLTWGTGGTDGSKYSITVSSNGNTLRNGWPEIYCVGTNVTNFNVPDISGTQPGCYWNP